MKKLFVHDLHGCLEQGTQYWSTWFTNWSLEHHGYEERLSQKEGERFFGMHWQEYFKFALPKASEQEIERLHLAAVNAALDNQEDWVQTLRPGPHSHRLLEAIAESEHDQILISNTQDESMPLFLESIDIARFFPNGNAFATQGDSYKMSKHEVLMLYAERHGPYDHFVIIGDAPGDMELKEVYPKKSTTYLYREPGRDFPDIDSDFKTRDLRDLLTEL